MGSCGRLCLQTHLQSDGRKPTASVSKKERKRRKCGNVKWAAATLTFSLRILRSGSKSVLFHVSVINIPNIQALMEACHYVCAACLLFSQSISSRLLKTVPACLPAPRLQKHFRAQLLLSPFWAPHASQTIASSVCPLKVHSSIFFLD